MNNKIFLRGLATGIIACFSILLSVPYIQSFYYKSRLFQSDRKVNNESLYYIHSLREKGWNTLHTWLIGNHHTSLSPENIIINYRPKSHKIEWLKLTPYTTLIINKGLISAGKHKICSTPISSRTLFPLPSEWQIEHLYYQYHKFHVKYTNKITEKSLTCTINPEITDPMYWKTFNN